MHSSRMHTTRALTISWGEGGHAWQGGVRGRGWGACIAGGGDMYSQGVCMAGEHCDRKHAWQGEGACVNGGAIHGSGCAWLQGMHDREGVWPGGHKWQGMCMVGLWHKYLTITWLHLLFRFIKKFSKINSIVRQDATEYRDYTQCQRFSNFCQKMSILVNSA